MSTTPAPTLTIDEAYARMKAQIDAEPATPPPPRMPSALLTPPDGTKPPPPCTASGCKSVAVKDWRCAEHGIAAHAPAPSPAPAAQAVSADDLYLIRAMSKLLGTRDGDWTLTRIADVARRCAVYEFTLSEQGANEADRTLRTDPTRVRRTVDAMAVPSLAPAQSPALPQARYKVSGWESPPQGAKKSGRVYVDLFDAPWLEDETIQSLDAKLQAALVTFESMKGHSADADRLAGLVRDAWEALGPTTVTTGLADAIRHAVREASTQLKAGNEEIAEVVKARDHAAANASAWKRRATDALAVRPVVAAFAVAMEERLRANDHKGGWDDLSAEETIGRLREETDELVMAMTARAKHPKSEPEQLQREKAQVTREAADVANFAMFAADLFGGLRAPIPSAPFAPRPAPARPRFDGFGPLGAAIGKLVEEKQAAYGDSFGKAGALMRVLYPKGIALEQLDDALAVVRVLDKLFRIATDRDALGESPWRDVAGYGLLGAARVEASRG